MFTTKPTIHSIILLPLMLLSFSLPIFSSPWPDCWSNDDMSCGWCGRGGLRLRPVRLARPFTFRTPSWWPTLARLLLSLSALLAVDERGAEVPPLAQQDWTMILKYEEAHGGRFEKEEVVVVERRAQATLMRRISQRSVR